jgi:hypothetical protein
MVLWAGLKKKLRLYVELKMYDKNRRKITGPQCVNMKINVALTSYKVLFTQQIKFIASGYE